MKRTTTGLLAIVLLLASAPFVVAEDAEASTSSPTMKFGMGGGSSKHLMAEGVTLDYETFWVGPWTLKYGWGGPNSHMTDLKSKGITPVIHFYYWGDDISPSCVENGCWSDLHNAWKDKAGWQELARQLVENVKTTMDGAPVIILMETEFNKGGIAEYEAFDGYLAEKSDYIKTGYPPAKTVMALGNWNSGAWYRFDQIAAAADYTGIQGMRGSTRDSFSSYLNLFEATVAGAEKLQSLFGKPVFVHDIALSSYPEPEYLKHQADEIGQFFTGMSQLKAAGVEAMIYRAWVNAAKMDLANYYGEAERHWGFAYAYSYEHKPSAQVWLDGIRQERGGTSPAPTGLPVDSAGGSFEAEAFAINTAGASFSDSKASGGQAWNLWSNGHLSEDFDIAPGEYDVSVRARGTTADGVGPEMVVSLGGKQVLKAYPGTSYGEHSVRLNASDVMDLRLAFTNDLRTSTEDRNLILDRVTFTQVAAAPEPGPEPRSTYMADFTVSPNINEWWVEVTVKAASEPAKVDVSIDGGSWIALAKTTWGTWAKSTYTPAGSSVVFQATDSAGQTATSQTYTWMSAESTEPQPNTAPTASFTSTTDGLTATFDASGSTDADGDALTYSWDLGDGSTATGALVEHAYASDGTYTVVLTVSDGTDNASTSAAISVERPNTAPAAAFTSTTDGLTVTLDASGSTDADGDALAYSWDLGDRTTATGAVVGHAYAASGTYTVTLTVDDGNATATSQKDVTVVKPNAAPTASFTSTTDGLKATLDASGSTDADGDTLTYSWDLGDGTSATGLLADHVYAESGTYTVTLTVDDGNATATSQKDVTVVKPNAAPTASFTSTTDGHTATLDASGSTDADGDALTYSWDLGDGTTKTGVAIGHTYAGDGSYTVTLTVDDGQATNTAQRTVSVAAPAPSQQYSADFRVSPNVNEWWVEVTVQATSEPAKVEVSVDGGSWIALDKTSWGTWAKSTYTPVGSSVVFRAMDASGQTATSSTYTWMTTEPEPDPFTATFRPKTQSNPWWVEVVVTASEEVVRVQACIGATCTDLSKTEWDSWAKKMRVKKGTEVVFVATSISGATATSQAFVWG